MIITTTRWISADELAHLLCPDQGDLIVADDDGGCERSARPVATEATMLDDAVTPGVILTTTWEVPDDD